MSQTVEKRNYPFWQRLLFSEMLLEKTRAKRIAYIGLMTALCIIANMFLEMKFADVQFSVTIFISMLTGMMIGPLYGFCAVFLGDLIGFIYNSWGFMYMPWVGLSVAFMALFAGLIVNGVKLPVKGGLYIKLALACLVSFLVCSVGINSTGFYFYNKAAGFSAAVVEYVETRFGTGVSYFGYCCYRLFFKGQIFNSIFNYVLIFLAVPVLNAVKPLGVNIK